MYLDTLYLTDARLMTMARMLSWQSLFVHLARCPERLLRRRMRTQTDPRVILESYAHFSLAFRSEVKKDFLICYLPNHVETGLLTSRLQDAKEELRD